MALGALIFSGCQDPIPRSYTEIAFKPNAPSSAERGAAGSGPVMDPSMMDPSMMPSAGGSQGNAGGPAGGPMSGPMAGGMPGGMMAPASDF